MKKFVLGLVGLLMMASAAAAQTPQRANTLTPATLPLTGTCTGSPPALPAIGVDTADPSTFLFQVAPCNIVLAEYAYTYNNTVTTGFSVTIAAGISNLALDPAGTLATGTIVFPAVAVDRWKISISSSAAITTLTMTPTGGTTIKGAATALAPFVPLAWQYLSSCTCWWPVAS